MDRTVAERLARRTNGNGDPGDSDDSDDSDDYDA